MNTYRSRGHHDIVAADPLAAAKVFANRTVSKINQPQSINVSMLRHQADRSTHIATAILKGNIIITVQFDVLELGVVNRGGNSDSP